MFTGIIEEIGRVKRVIRKGKSISLDIASRIIVEDIKKGDSVSVNGVCLTIVDFGFDFFVVDAVEETVSRTNLGNLNSGSYVNLERARKFGDRIDGHIVQGHIDTTGKVARIIPLNQSKLFYFHYPNDCRKYLVPKGSISVDGISLTIANLDEETFSVSVIPYTFENTILKYLQVGGVVNLEFDMIGKYVVNYLSLNNSSQHAKSSFWEQFIQKQNF